jgi:1-acyl-sn-glycerol-3-phosphate acyltransferase
VRAYGPGQYQIPLTGPAIVISNHAAWLDPIWLAKALPCRLTPMMTSRFFDLPFVGWVVRVLAKAIRVPDTGFRRETPEIQQAIERLREGHVVLVFPEGRMRRNEKQPLRRFGQGIYHILRDQPGIPVISCWIDGNWGSFTSFSGGPPTKNKKMDLWRPINIGVSEPIIVPTDILADANLTRRYMMQACLGARARLGLEVPEVTSFADREEDDEPGTG